MATAELLDLPAETTADPVEQRFVVDHLAWHQYQAIAEALDEARIRINYDRGRLELMTVSSRHEWLKKLLGRLIEALTLELRIPIRSAGSWTLRREELNRGAESDDCYYVTSLPFAAGMRSIWRPTRRPIWASRSRSAAAF